MAYRNKLYVAFDGDVDMNYYNTLRMWRDNENIDFSFYDAHNLNIARDTSLPESIKTQLRERMQNSKAMLLLVGDKTKNIRGYIPWEIGYAQYLALPIIVANLNGRRSYDSHLCPSALEDGKGAMHISFKAKIIKYAIENWPDFHNADKTNVLASAWNYKDSFYQELGL